MIWILLGAPGAGKGTQAQRLAAASGLAHVSTGDLLRSAAKRGSELGEKARLYMDAGELVPDELILGLVRETLEGPAVGGCILDGYPRNEAQAGALDAMLAELGREISGVVNLEVGEDILVERISGRAKAEDRVDDSAETVRNRLRVYREQTQPLIDLYRKRGLLKEINGVGTIEEVQRRIVTATSMETAG